VTWGPPPDRHAEPPIRRVVLVGIMGSGKSTVGRLLAHRLGWEFVDLDGWIEQRAGRRIADIFRDEGEPRFREWEATATASLADVDRLVLAPGGGWVTDPRNPERLGEGSLVVWLRVSAADALARLAGERSNRPLLHGAEPGAAITRLLDERESMYSRADLHVETAERTPSEVARQIGEYVLRRMAPASPDTQE
jgi:shikimate kinase